MLGAWMLSLALTAAGSSSEGLEAVRAVLARSEGSVPTSEKALVQRLTALGPAAAPALFTLVTGAGIEELLAPSDDPRAWLCAPEQVGELALAALGKLPPGIVLAELRACEATHPERDLRVAEVRVLGSLGSAQSLGFLFELMGAFAEEIELRTVRDPLKSALIDILRNDSQAFRTLEEELKAAPLERLRLVSEALTAAASPDAADLLEDLLGRDPELDVTALEGLTELELRFPWRLRSGVAPRLRTRLESPDAAVRAAAARQLGMLRDGPSVPALIARVSDPDASVARAALWAVHEMSGRKDLADAKSLQSWFEDERTWWKEQGMDLLEGIDPQNPAQLAESLRLLLTHPLGHAQIAEELVENLPNLAPEAQRFLCRTLAGLGDASAVPALIELLDHSEPTVRQAAFDALRTLTGQDLPLEPGLWEEYAFG